MPFISASAISPYNKIRGGAAEVLVPVILLLDSYPDALVAYDLRKLSSNYIGGCIEVRRGSDNTIQDIGFSNNILDTSSLVDFAEGGECFIRTLYDQSGNANNAVETTFTSQPRITDTSGLVITKYGKPSMYWNNPSSGEMSNLTFTEVRPHTLFITQQLENIGGAYQNWILGGAYYDYLSASNSNQSTGVQYLSNANPPNSVKQGNNYLNGQLKEFVQNEPNFIQRDENFNMISMVHDSSASRLPYASEISKRTQSTGVQNASTIGWRQSIIIYGTDQSANRIAIEDNINKYYGIYPNPNNTGLLDDYPNASSAYSLRSLNSNYRGPLVKVRRLADSTEKEIFAKYDGTLNTEDLLDFIGSDDGFVSKWYDQSGNENDMIQNSASAQPQIVDQGSIITKDSNPCVKFVSSNLLVASPVASISSCLFSFYVITSARLSIATAHSVLRTNNSNTGTTVFLDLRSSPKRNLFIHNGSKAADLSVARETNARRLLSSFGDGNSNIFSFDNGATGGSDSSVSPTDNNTLQMSATASVALDGNITELIVYPTDTRSDRVAIETNINNYYTIY
tara:strand:- start:197 stop:1897 length:1701 start_codon:yes stop_codon:yes gene_type:complete